MTEARLGISVNLAQRGGKWYLALYSTGFEDEVYEYDDEATARAALAKCLETCQAHPDAGEIVIRGGQR